VQLIAAQADFIAAHLVDGNGQVANFYDLAMNAPDPMPTTLESEAAACQFDVVRAELDPDRASSESSCNCKGRGGACEGVDHGGGDRIAPLHCAPPLRRARCEHLRASSLCRTCDYDILLCKISSRRTGFCSDQEKYPRQAEVFFLVEADMTAWNLIKVELLGMSQVFNKLALNKAS